MAAEIAAHKVLVVDDDEVIHELMAELLREHISVSFANNGPKALELARIHQPDLILLDVMMPRMDGWETCRRIREVTGIPIIFLTAKSDEPDRLQGFRLGADDYVPKPFSFPELVARVQAVLRRSALAGDSALADDKAVLICGPYRLDRARHLVTRDGQPLDLTPTEYRLLEVLMSQPGVVFSQEQLVTGTWGGEYADDTGYIRRYVWHLRQKIEPDPDNPQHLLTERGFGYRIVP